MNKVNELFAKELKVVNLGVKSFYEDLKAQQKQVVHVEWKPVAGGNQRLADMLKLLQ
ncbi:MAG: fdrA domain protein [Oscillospiraceae bacterium]|nr:fdrA domain protein [Oscillospiraceae bacterium]